MNLMNLRKDSQTSERVFAIKWPKNDYFILFKNTILKDASHYLHSEKSPGWGGVKRAVGYVAFSP